MAPPDAIDLAIASHAVHANAASAPRRRAVAPGGPYLLQTRASCYPVAGCGHHLALRRVQRDFPRLILRSMRARLRARATGCISSRATHRPEKFVMLQTAVLLGKSEDGARDETFNIGADTGTPVDDRDYQVPFKFTGEINKLTMRSMRRS